MEMIWVGLAWHLFLNCLLSLYLNLYFIMRSSLLILRFWLAAVKEIAQNYKHNSNQIYTTSETIFSKSYDLILDRKFVLYKLIMKLRAITWIFPQQPRRLRRSRQLPRSRRARRWIPRWPRRRPARRPVRSRPRAQPRPGGARGQARAWTGRPRGTGATRYVLIMMYLSLINDQW